MCVCVHAWMCSCADVFFGAHGCVFCVCVHVCKECVHVYVMCVFFTYYVHVVGTLSMQPTRHGIFPPIGGFPPIERSHSSFLRSVQIRWENYRVYLICERFSESNFVNLPRSSISFLHGTFSNGVNLFCFGHHQSVHGLTESTTKGSNPIVTCKSAV